jgi:hypothetical protein
VDARFWEDTRVRVLPYDRGAIYFAVLNGKIRRASGGRQTIDDLIRTTGRLLDPRAREPDRYGRRHSGAAGFPAQALPHRVDAGADVVISGGPRTAFAAGD